jgi:hypothetical protein
MRFRLIIPLFFIFISIGIVYSNWIYNPFTDELDYFNDVNVSIYLNNTTAYDIFQLRSDWSTHDNYPSSCPSGNYVSGIGDILTCSQPSSGGNTTQEIISAINISSTFLLTSSGLDCVDCVNGTELADTITLDNNLEVNGGYNVSIDSGELFVDVTNNRIGIGTTAIKSGFEIKKNTTIGFQACVIDAQCTSGGRCDTFYGKCLYDFSVSGVLGIGTAKPLSEFEVTSLFLDDVEQYITSLGNGTKSTLSLYSRRANSTGGIMETKNDDLIGVISSKGWDGDRTSGGEIRFYADDDWGEGDTSDAPTRISFWTASNGVQTLTQRMTINRNGNVGIGIEDAHKKFEVVGDINITGSNWVNASQGITNATGFWMCKDSLCLTTCQVDIKGGIIVGCT